MNNNFEHLQIPLVLTGKPRYIGIPIGQNELTVRNKENRVSHGTYIKRQAEQLSRFWSDARNTRMQNNLPELPAGIPLMLEIDPDIDVDFLRGLGFEIVSEVDNGFVLVSSEDINLERFNLKLQNFIDEANKKCNSPAKIYGLKTNDDRVDKILSDSLKEKWNEINDNTIYLIEISISCSGEKKIPEKPLIENNEDSAHYEHRLSNWKVRYDDAYSEWDMLAIERQNNIERFIEGYDGSIITYIDNAEIYINFPDSFTAKVSINGKGLKDIVTNFPYVFEIILLEDIAVGNASSNNSFEEVNNINIISPSQDSPIIGIIDSGIEINNPLITPAIYESYSYVPNDSSTDDKVRDTGHGTSTAGLLLYNNIELSGDITLPYWIRNIRVLDENNDLRKELVGADLISNIIKKYNIETNRKTRIFNHSIGESKPCKLVHMSSWAAVIDKYSYENDILFIQSAGNLKPKEILDYVIGNNNYPDYLNFDASRICNPAQSLQALTVGSISPADYIGENVELLGEKDKPSSFSRSGPGIWDSIKPDVVEYGGNYALKREGNNLNLLRPTELCINAPVKSKNRKLFSKSIIGTSFSTPKVAQIAATLEKQFPGASTLLYRGLIAQSARWPVWAHSYNNKSEVIRRLGYGLPSLERATTNNEYRVTLFADNMQIESNNAHVYKVPIPESIRNIGEDYDILIEVTLSYCANSRRTRRRIKGYLSTWLDWSTSRLGEDYDIFKNRVFTTGRVDENDEGVLKWTIGERRNYGQANDFSTKFSTLQKDWAFINSHQLPEDFCIAVKAHKGWDDASLANYSLIVSFEAIDKDVEIYNEIRTAVEVEIENSRAQIQINNNI